MKRGGATYIYEPEDGRYAVKTSVEFTKRGAPVIHNGKLRRCVDSKGVRAFRSHAEEIQAMKKNAEMVFDAMALREQALVTELEELRVAFQRLQSTVNIVRKEADSKWTSLCDNPNDPISLRNGRHETTTRTL